MEPNPTEFHSDPIVIDNFSKIEIHKCDRGLGSGEIKISQGDQLSELEQDSSSSGIRLRPDLPCCTFFQ